MIRFSRPCEREIRKLPETIRGDLADALARLDAGLTLTMPLSRPMPRIAPGVHELRLRDRSGTYRVFYRTSSGTVHVLHAFKKTMERTPDRTMELVQNRLGAEKP
ncbi:MAG: type II toxin-antitoxin system RelE/ParE family toxin [Pseudomonadota bacterium]